MLAYKKEKKERKKEIKIQKEGVQFSTFCSSLVKCSLTLG